VEFPGEVVVDHVDADLFGALLGVFELLRAQVVDQEGDIVPDPLVVGLERLGVEVLDGAPEVGVLKERLQDFFLQVENVAVVQ
jgi:hypothetical protein